MPKTSPLSSKSSPNELSLRPSSPVPAPSFSPLQLLAMVALGPGEPPPSRLSLPPIAQAPSGGAACTALATAAPTTRERGTRDNNISSSSSSSLLRAHSRPVAAARRRGCRRSVAGRQAAPPRLVAAAAAVGDAEAEMEPGKMSPLHIRTRN
uniref:Uncharacterized protein n=1 Tax=Oryza glumipatula TaxID=40148 RepID=A0A0E0AFZ6_9ORYZ